MAEAHAKAVEAILRPRIGATSGGLRTKVNCSYRLVSDQVIPEALHFRKTVSRFNKSLFAHFTVAKAVGYEIKYGDTRFSGESMIGHEWTFDSLTDLALSVREGKLFDNAGFSSRDELCSAIEIAGDSPDADVRGAVQDALYYLDKERAFPYLLRCLNDQDSSVRWGAVTLMPYYGERITVPLINTLQTDPDVSVRCAAATILGDFGGVESLPALRHAALHDHAQDDQGYIVSYSAEMAIKTMNYRSRHNATYDPFGARSLVELIEIDEQEDAS